MAVIGPQNRGIPSYKPAAPFKPVTVGPQNVGLPGYRPGDVGNPNGALRGVLPAPAAPAPPAPPAAPAPPPIDFSTVVGNDPQYIREQALNSNANQIALDQLAKQFATTRQGYQDNANAHGALFSGAAVHGQNYAAQNYADQSRQQAQNANTTASNSLASAWQRILTQYAGGVA